MGRTLALSLLALSSLLSLSAAQEGFGGFLDPFIDVVDGFVDGFVDGGASAAATTALVLSAAEVFAVNSQLSPSAAFLAADGHAPLMVGRGRDRQWGRERGG